MPDYILGIDNGGTIAKTVIFDLQGREIQAASRVIEMHYPHAGWTERDLDAVWQGTVESIQECIERAQIDPKDILAVGNTGHGNGFYLLDKAGKPLRAGVNSTDTRAAAVVANWEAQGITAQTWQYTRQQLWPGQPPALLAWLKTHEPEAYKNIGWVLMTKDHIKYCLTGEINTDYTDVSGANMMHLEKRAYSDDLFALYGIDDLQYAMPPMIETYDIAGKVTQEAARLTGLIEGTPVVGGIFDIDAAALGAGAITPGQACIIGGTWSINEVITDKPIDNPDLFMNCLYIDNHYLALEASPTSASNLEWFVKHFCDTERAEAKARGISVYDVCNEMVEKLGPGGTNVIFHPYLFGSNVQSTARAGFYGMGGWHRKDHILRAVYEGIVYSHLSHIEKLRAMGIEMTSARFTGGAARSQVWSQMFADAIEIPMEIVEGEEIGARGAAICAGIGVGVYADYQDAVTKAVKVERQHLPNAEATPYYKARYEEHQFVGQVMGEAWERLSRLKP